MQRFLLPTLLALIAAQVCEAQLALYDAGTAGDPAVAPDPQFQGWSLIYSGGPGVTFTPISPDPGTGLNAWEINDIQNNGVGNSAYYALYPANVNVLSVLSDTFELVATLKMSAGQTPATFMQVSSGSTFIDSIYRVFFQVVGTDVVVGNPALGWQVTCSGGADGAYHTYSIRKTVPGMYGDAELVYDGLLVGTVVEQAINPGIFIADGVLFGTFDEAGTGRSRWNRVEFRRLEDLGLVHCDPAVNNSTGSPALISAYGSPYIDQNFVEITASSLPTNQFGYLLASLNAGFVANPGGSQGNLCLASNIARFVSQVQTSGASGSFTVPVNLTAIPANPDVAVASGETWNFQCWYRDQNPSSTSNFTDAVRITFQ